MQTHLGEHTGGTLCTIATDAHQTIETQFMIGIFNLFPVFLIGGVDHLAKYLLAGSTQDGSSQIQNAGE